MTMKRKHYNEGSALQESEKWQIMEWLWDKLPDCPSVDNVVDVAAAEGTMTITTKNGNEYTITMKKGNWREI